MANSHKEHRVNGFVRNFSYYLRRIYDPIYFYAFFLTFVDGLIGVAFRIVRGKRNRTNEFCFTQLVRIDRFRMRKFWKKDRYDFKGIYFPQLPLELGNIGQVYEDVLKVFVEHDDKYNWQYVDKLDKRIPEGVYCYEGPNGEDITVKPGYTVIDAGAWIGDFSAYAAKKGAKVYAFEPSKKNQEYLKKTVEYNGNIFVETSGLGERDEILGFSDNSVGSHFGEGADKINVVSLDSWVKKNNIRKIDFIKADIEGAERSMLLGAKEVLAKHKPILSICTYHLWDDPLVLENIIREANPKYIVVQRKLKLFAYVPRGD